MAALMYLIQYMEPTDPSRYHVRAYDLHTGRLLTKPITDPRERGEKMRGSPITRMTSPDGRFAYTFYDGAGSTPFIHALDTSHGTATCIHLDVLTGNQDLWRRRLALDHDGALAVSGRPRHPRDRRHADLPGHHPGSPDHRYRGQQQPRAVPDVAHGAGRGGDSGIGARGRRHGLPEA